MHMGSVLKKLRTDAESADAVYSANAKSGSLRDGRGYGGCREREPSDVREEARRRAAAEKELRQIFERTYGSEKKSPRIDKEEKIYSPELSEEEAAKSRERNLEIKAKHVNRRVEPSDKPVLILIDGYNLIFADDYLKDLAKADIGSARDQITERLCNYASYTGCELAVVFDAYKEPYGSLRETEINGIKVIFTSENEPADIRIGVMTDTIKDRQIYTVSSDSLLQQDAWTHGALRISSRDFLDMLGKTEQEIREKLK